jgi:preprotein translocase subunit SecF
MRAILLYTSLLVSGIGFSQTTTIQTSAKQAAPIEETKEESSPSEEQPIVVQSSMGKQVTPIKVEAKEEVVKPEQSVIIQTPKKKKK